MIGTNPATAPAGTGARIGLAMLRDLNRERGQTIILVTHDPQVGAACDRIVRMLDGLIVGDERSVVMPSAGAAA